MASILETQQNCVVCYVSSPFAGRALSVKPSRVRTPGDCQVRATNSDCRLQSVVKPAVKLGMSVYCHIFHIFRETPK